jgi:hypoxanthine phosphoribosyltransferase
MTQSTGESGPRNIAWETLATTEQVDARISDMASWVVERYAGEKPLFVCLLKGAVPFASRLMNSIQEQAPTFVPDLNYMRISTYGSGTKAGDPYVVADCLTEGSLAGRPAVLLDDVLDTGATLPFAAEHLREQHDAGQVDSLVLVQKTVERPDYPSATLYGFESPPDWLVGMGMNDQGEEGRWWNEIRIKRIAD